MTPDWQQQAACRGMDTNLFFGAKGDTATMKTAMETCNGGTFDQLDPKGNKIGRHELPACPVQQNCLNFALSFPADQDQHGIFGGMTPHQRWKLRTANRQTNPFRDREIPVPISIHRSRIERKPQSRIERESGSRIERKRQSDGGSDGAPPARWRVDDEFRSRLADVFALLREAWQADERATRDARHAETLRRRAERAAARAEHGRETTPAETGAGS